MPWLPCVPHEIKISDQGENTNNTNMNILHRRGGFCSAMQTIFFWNIIVFISFAHSCADTRKTLLFPCQWQLCVGGGARRICKNMAAQKCEQVPVVGGCVYSGWGVKDTLLICPPGLHGCQNRRKCTVGTVELMVKCNLVIKWFPAYIVSWVRFGW